MAGPIGAAGPSQEALLKLMETEWADIHHSRGQEWSALVAVTTLHVAITQMPTLLEKMQVTMPSWIGVTGILLGIAFAVVGAAITLHHRCLFVKKIRWIYDAELKIGLVKTVANPLGVIPEEAKCPAAAERKGFSMPSFRSTSGLILCFYVLLMLFDLLYLFPPLTG